MVGSEPNVVLIHCHDLGRRIGCYDRDVDTPALESLADDGAVFENHFVTAPQCSPSRSSIHTGEFPHVNGLMGLAHGRWEIDDRFATLPAALAEREYETYLFGLQHAATDPQSLGFEHVFPGGARTSPVSPTDHAVNRARDVARAFRSFLDNDPPTEPFFASLGFFEAHRVRLDDRYGFDDDNYEMADPAGVEALPYLPDRERIRRDLAEMEGMIEAIDEAVDAVLDALDAADLADDTLVVFTTEHGIAFPRAKGCCYDPGIEAALLLRYPGEIDGGERYDELVSNVDLFPTILEMADGTVLDEVSGQSFLPLFTDQEHYQRELVFAEMTWHDRYNPIRAVRTERYKYIRSFWHLPDVYMTDDILMSEAGRAVREEFQSNPRPYAELYDLEADPYERDNLAEDDQYRHVRDELERRLVAWMRRTEDPLLSGPIPPADYDEIVPW
ncbi:sulfatase [Natronoarchaeum mannanilyticum]|uniref:sulfatase family protein n=1 Tax=Natronoarchaeum mannanilyticum TaxID=926360 RepID=UPI0031E2F729